MLLPWLVAIAIEWVVLARAFRSELGGAAASAATAERRPIRPSSRSPCSGLTLVGFVWSSSRVGGGGRGAGAGGARAAVAARARRLRRAGLPRVRARRSASWWPRRATTASRDAVDSLIPHGAGLPALIAIAVLAAVVANLVNNLPATLIMLPAVAAGGAGPVLAMLVGVNVGPNLSYVGSLATLLWRRVMHAHDEPTDIRAFTVLGLSTVPAILLAATVSLWLALQVV